jgi:hypothetical protein
MPKSLMPVARKLQILLFRMLVKFNMHKDILKWKTRKYSMPAPTFVKWAVLERYGSNGTWIETGTFMGDTTIHLARSAQRVYTIEPQPQLALNARNRLRKFKNVTVLEGLSETIFPDLLDQVEGKISVWLDGHFSSGDTHQGPQDTPIREELNAIEARLEKFQEIAVFVDDFRCFDPQIPEFNSYPEKAFLVNWAERCNLNWNIEHDIFIAVRKN